MENVFVRSVAIPFLIKKEYLAQPCNVQNVKFIWKGNNTADPRGSANMFESFWRRKERDINSPWKY
jgi:hypothetical protein